MMKCLVTAIASMMIDPPKRSVASARVTIEKSLRLYRTEQAFAKSVPATSVYGNKLISEICLRKPTTLKQLLGMRGMGAKRCKSYGEDIIKLVALGGGLPSKYLKSSLARPDSSAKHKAGRSKPKNPKVKAGKGKGQSKKPQAKPRPRPSKPPKPRPRPACAASPRLSPEMDLSQTPSLNPSLNPSLTSNPTPTLTPSPTPASPPKLSLTPSALLTSSRPFPRAPKQGKTTVYILELQDGRVYVGSSKDVERRISQHTTGQGSAYTRVYKPTGVRLPRLGNVSGDGDAAERDETLRYMFQRGIPFVRGWKFTQVVMPPEEFEEAEANIRELFDLCRRCGYKGHFINQCRATYDRWGKQCEA